MDNQQPSSEQEKVQRLSRERVGREAEAVGIRKDEDIVRTLVKAKAQNELYRSCIDYFNNHMVFRR